MRYNLSSGGAIALGGSSNLSQNELFNLSKQKNLKQRLRNIMLSLDLQNKGTVAFNKFQIESKDVGITLSPDDFKSLLILFEVKEHYDHRRN